MAQVSVPEETFLARCREFARDYCRQHGSVWIDPIRAWAKAHDLEPHHPNVWGAMFKEDGWVHVATRQSAIVTNNARDVKVWRWLPGYRDPSGSDRE